MSVRRAPTSVPPMEMMNPPYQPYPPHGFGMFDYDPSHSIASSSRSAGFVPNIDPYVNPKPNDDFDPFLNPKPADDNHM
ncbi:uncharacterized protein HKW66_Vig0185040 [Vigna angularis]|nr:uncharacterized protein HKW66_Vig0185040 [Vigna angularis]